MSGQVFDFQPNSTFPLKINGLSVNNTGTVTMAYDPAGTANTVFQFNGSNYLQYSIITPVVNTRCFWVYSASPSTGGGSVFSSSSYAIWFAGTNKLGFQANYSAAAVSRTAINATQTSAWTHYAIVSNGTTITVYVNGTVDISANSSLNSTDSSPIQFGALSGANNFTGYMHSMRLYMRALNSAEVNSVYYSTRLVVSVPAITHSTPGLRFMGTHIGYTFDPYLSGTKVSNTGWKINGTDIANLYAPYTSGQQKSASTGFLVNGMDISDLFNLSGITGINVASLNSDSALAMWYKFNSSDVSGTTVYEHISKSYNGTLVSSATISSSDYPSGQGSLQLNGSNYMTSTASFTTGSNGVTFACWFKANNTGDYSRIFNFGQSFRTNAIFMLVRSSANGGKIGVSVFNGTTSGDAFDVYSLNVNDGKWRHMAWVINSGGSNVLYLNGTQVATFTTNYPPAVSRNLNYFGQNEYLNSILNGAINDFRVYNRSLTSSEIYTLSTTNYLSYVSSGLTHHYNFMTASYSGSGSSVINLVTNSADMTLYGSPTYQPSKTMWFVNTTTNQNTNTQCMQSTSDSITFQSISIWYRQLQHFTICHLFDGRTTAGSSGANSLIYTSANNINSIGSAWTNCYYDGSGNVSPSWTNNEFTIGTWHNATFTSSSPIVGGNLTFAGQYGKIAGCNIEIAAILVYNRQISESENKINYDYFYTNYISKIINANSQLSFSNATGIYSYKLLNNSYSGPLFNIRRSSDNATSNFYADSNGNLGTSVGATGTTLKSWLSTSTAYIVTWYDQSPAGNNATQSTTSKQPIYNTVLQKPDFTGTTYFTLPNGTVPYNNSPYTVMFMGNSSSISGNNGYLGSGILANYSSNSFNLSAYTAPPGYTNGYNNYWYARDAAQSTGIGYSKDCIVTHIYNTTNVKLYIKPFTNGSSPGTLQQTFSQSGRNSTAANNLLGINHLGATEYWNGVINSIYIFNSALTDVSKNLFENSCYDYYY